MKKLLFLVGSAAVLLFSCGNPKKETTNNAPANDTLSVLFKDAALPLLIDTNILYKLETFDSIKSNVINLLALEIDTSELTKDNLYTLNTFYKIDSLKTAGKYKQYCDSLDIGMPKNATAHALYKIKMDSNTTGYVWGIHYTSYEACPSTTTNTAFISVMHNKKITETFCLGNAFWFADPPNISNEWTYTTITKNPSVFMDETKTVDDIDDSLAPEITHWKTRREFKPY